MAGNSVNQVTVGSDSVDFNPEHAIFRADQYRISNNECRMSKG